MKRATTLLLLVFVAASVVYLMVGGRGGAEGVPSEAVSPGPSPAQSTDMPAVDAGAEPAANDAAEGLPVATVSAPAEAAEAETDGPQLVVYYFHRTQRCHTCLTMEAYAKDILTQTFPKQFESGEIEWRLVDIETPANEHFVHDFELTSNALVMVKPDGDQRAEWKSLDRIWELVGNEQEFKTYVREHALAYLGDEP